MAGFSNSSTTVPLYTSERICNKTNGPLVLKVNDEKKLAEYKQNIIKQWPIIKNRDNFPGPQPISLERKDIYKMEMYFYTACEKTDGMRYLLYANSKGPDKNVFLIDRAFRFYKVNITFSDYVFNETIIDGELVCNNTGQWCFYIHDCICLSGINVSKSPFNIRYAFIKKAVETKNYTSTLDAPFTLKLKKFWDFCKFSEMLQYYTENRPDHKVDGLIFTPLKLGVGTGTQMSLFKWKYHHTFDFSVIKRQANGSNSRYDMYIIDKGKMTKYCSLNERTSNGRTFAEVYNKIVPDPKSSDPVIIECSYNSNTQSYIPILIRTDKTYPNSINTIRKTLLNIEEDLQINDILNSSKVTKIPTNQDSFDNFHTPKTSRNFNAPIIPSTPPGF